MRLLYVIILFFMSFLFVSCSNYDLKDRGKSYIEKGNIVISSDNASEHGVSVKMIPAENKEVYVIIHVPESCGDEKYEKEEVWLEYYKKAQRVLDLPLLVRKEDSKDLCFVAFSVKSSEVKYLQVKIKYGERTKAFGRMFVYYIPLSSFKISWQPDSEPKIPGS